MSCRDIPAGPIATYDSLQQMYIGLGIRRHASGVRLNATSETPEGGFNLSPLANPEAGNCLNALIGGGNSSRLSGTPLRDDVRDIRQTVDYFRSQGNTDGNADVISAEEIEAYVNAAAEGQEGFDKDGYRALTVTNLAAYLAVVDYVGSTDAVPEETIPTEPLTAAIATYGSVQQMYTGLVGDVTGTANSARASVSEEIPAEGIDISVLNEENIDRFKQAIGWTGEEPTSVLATDAQEILTVVEYLRTEGNHDGGPNVVTRDELSRYVNAARGSESFASVSSLTVGNLRALVACVDYVSHHPVAAPVSPDAGTPPTTDAGPTSPNTDAGTPDAAAPDVVTPPSADATADTNPADATPPEADIVFEEDAATILDDAMTQAADAAPQAVADADVPADAGATDAGRTGGTHHRGHRNQGFSFTLDWKVLLGGVVVLLGFGALGGYLLGQRGSGNSPAPQPNPGPAPVSPQRPNTPQPESDRAATQAPRTETARPATPPPLPRTQTTTTPSGPNDQELQAALNALPSMPAVSFDPNAQPTTGAEPAVIRTQIVLRYRHFLSLAARNALQNNQPLPAGTQLVQSQFAQAVDALTNEVFSRYQNTLTTNPDALRQMWLEERGQGLPIIQRGVPDRMLTEVLRPRLQEMGRAGSPAEAATLVLNVPEARDHFADRASFEHAFREILRHGR